MLLLFRFCSVPFPFFIKSNLSSLLTEEEIEHLIEAFDEFDKNKGESTSRSTHTHAHTPTPTHPHTHTRTHARTHVRTHARTHTRTHARTHAHTYTQRETERQRETDRDRQRQTEIETETEKTRVCLSWLTSTTLYATKLFTCICSVERLYNAPHTPFRSQER